MKDNDSEVLARIEAKIIALDKKMDALMMRSSPKPMERERSSYSGRRHDFHQQDKAMHKAVCSECGQACEIPFKPSGDRPVFCSECFARQQGEGSAESRFDKKPRDFRKPGGSSKPFHKKKGNFQKRKKYAV